MNEYQLKSVQHLALRSIAGQLSQTLVLAVAISRVANERKAEELEMDADLVGAPGVQDGLGQCRPAQTLQHAIAGSGLAPRFIVDRHPLAMRAMPGNRGSNLALLALHFTTNNRMIDLIDLSAGKLGRERQVRFVIFGNDHAAGSFAVEPMNDAGPGHAADAAQLAAAMVQQGVHQRMALVTGSGMDH